MILWVDLSAVNEDHFSMTNEQRNLKRVLDQQSETREKINTMLGQPEADRSDTFTADLRAMTTKSIDLEVEYRAASQAKADTDEKVTPTETATDPEVRERLELRSKARLGRWMATTLSGRALDGAEAEYRAACGIGDGWPIDFFEQDRPRPLEVRADAATVAPSTAQGENVAALQPFLFSESIAPRFGIDMATVGSGAHTEPRISVALTAAPKTKGTAQQSTAATIVGVTAKPRRIAARLTVGMEDVASFGNDSFESSLRENARGVLSDAYDNQCINGNGTSPNVDGLISQLTNPANPTSIADFDDFVETFANQIDGLWASRMSDVAIVANVDSYKLSAKTFRDRVIDTGQRGGVSLGDVSAADYLAAKTAGWSTNKRMPATASTIAKGIVFRSGRPGLRTAVHPTWGMLTIDDQVTDAASGERHFTLSVLVGDKVLLVQPDAYNLVEYKVA